MLGYTYLANIYDVDYDILTSEEIIRLLLVRSVESVNMTPVLHTLQIVKFPIPIKGKLKGDFGISAGMILVESHIYIHTWPENNFARFELSSCRDINKKSLEDVLYTILGNDIKIYADIYKWQERV